MRARFNNIDSGSFSLNGISYYKVFIPVAIGNVAVKVVSIYDSRFELLPPTNLEDIRVNGTAYGSVASLVNDLKGVVFDYPDITASIQAEIDDIRNDVQIIFKEDIVVNGDANRYYMVVIDGGDNVRVRNLKVYRNFNETAPSTWNTATHKGSLLLELRTNFGNWGGSRYDWKVLDFREEYTTMFANAGHCNHNIGFYVMLRGGGALYHIESDQSLSNLNIYYSSSEITFNHTNPAHRRYALDPLTSPNTSNIDAHTYAVGI